MCSEISIPPGVRGSRVLSSEECEEATSLKQEELFQHQRRVEQQRQAGGGSPSPKPDGTTGPPGCSSENGDIVFFWGGGARQAIHFLIIFRNIKPVRVSWSNGGEGESVINDWVVESDLKGRVALEGGMF